MPFEQVDSACNTDVKLQITDKVNNVNVISRYMAEIPFKFFDLFGIFLRVFVLIIRR